MTEPGASMPPVPVTRVRDSRQRTVGVIAVAAEVAEHTRAEDALRESERQLAEVERIAEMGSWTWDVADNQVRWSDELCRIYGIDRSDFDATIDGYLARVHPDDVDDARAAIEAALANRSGFSFDERIVRPDGSVRVLRSKGHAHLDSEGRVVRMTGICQDITERVRADEERARSEERFRLLAENAQDLVFRYRLQPHPGFDYVSPASVRITGYTPAEYYADPDLAVRTVHPSDLDGLVAALDLRAVSTRPQTLRLVRKDGEVVWVEQRVVPFYGDDGQLTALEGIARDITERKRAEEQLAHQALHDPLSGLPNRTLFMDRLGQALARSERNPTGTVAVLFLDLDQFKLVNDSLSHQVGDAVLVEVGRRIRQAIRPGDTVARFGGDEFAVLCEDAGDVHQVVAIAGRIGEAVKAPISVTGRDVFASASIGIAIDVEGRGTADTLLRDADAAMYRAKERGRDRCELFDEAMRARAFHRLNIEQGLRGVAERGELRLVYQPIFAVADGTPMAVEALVRWDHPERGVVPPAEFVPLAEQSGLILPIDAFVLRAACHQAAEWRRAHPGADVIMSVNISARQLALPGLANLVADTLEDAGLDPSVLCLEITESALMDDAISAIELLRVLRGLGVCLAIDDFGTGYSSLSYLKRFPIDALKIDQAFVDGLGVDPEDSAIVAAVVGLGHILGMRVVAEGVETEAQLAELGRLGCDGAQGYLLGKPSSPEDAESLVWPR